MTATTRAPRWLSAHERFRRHGGELTTVRIDAEGRVCIYRVRMVATATGNGEVHLWPTRAAQQLLGHVDPEQAYSYVYAEGLLAGAGWRRTDTWTTIDRYPAARIERIPQAEQARCLSLLIVGDQPARLCQADLGHDGPHRHGGVQWHDSLGA